MNKTELLDQIDKLHHRWTYHAVEHRQKRENNSPSYNAYDHGVATGMLKALTMFKDYVAKIEPTLKWEDIRKILEISDEIYEGGSYHYSEEDCEDILNRFNKRK